MPSEKKLPDGRWRVFVSRETPGGRQQANATRVTLREAREAAKTALERKVKEQDLALHPGELFRDLTRDFMELHPALSPTTRRGYEGIRRKHTDPALGRLALVDVTPTVLLRYQAEKLKTLSPVTVEHHMSFVRAVLAFGVRTRRLEWNAAEAVKQRKPKPRRRRALSLDELSTVLTAADALRNREPKRKGADSPDLYGPLLIGACSGLRRGELLGLRWQDVDRETGVVTASQNLVKPVGESLVLKGTKAEAEDARVVLLPAVALDELVAEHKRQAAHMLREPGWNREGVVFCDRRGQWRNPDTFTHHVGALLRECGIEGVDLHSFRHTHATIMHELGADITIIRGRQGHSDVRMTERYVHDTVKVQKPAVARLNRALAQKLPLHRGLH